MQRYCVGSVQYEFIWTLSRLRVYCDRAKHRRRDYISSRTAAVYTHLQFRPLGVQNLDNSWPHGQKGKAQEENHLASGTEGAKKSVLIWSSSTEPIAADAYISLSPGRTRIMRLIDSALIPKMHTRGTRTAGRAPLGDCGVAPAWHSWKQSADCSWNGYSF